MDRVVVVPICVCIHLPSTGLGLAMSEEVVSRLFPSSFHVRKITPYFEVSCFIKDENRKGFWSDFACPGKLMLEAPFVTAVITIKFKHNLG